MVLAIVAGVVVLTTGAAWAASQTNALHLFRSNPQYDPTEPGDALWHQTVIGSSVTRAATVTIPGAGKATFWYAKTHQGGWCAALRLPTGVWSGEPGSEGGTVPGCFPTRTQINGSDPVYVITGFDYQEGLLTVHGTLWRIYYGIVDGRGPAVRVTDRRAGRSTTVRRWPPVRHSRAGQPDRRGAVRGVQPPGPGRGGHGASAALSGGTTRGPLRGPSVRAFCGRG